jgi:hypothetical protein
MANKNELRLKEMWAFARTIFVNPPYGRAREPWVEACIACRGVSSIVLLMPAHTETKCFQKAARYASYLVFIKSRVKFGILRPNRRQAAASHGSVLFGFGVDLRKTGLGVCVTLAD